MVNSLARPGGNVTGITILGGEKAESDWNCLKRPFLKFPVSESLRPPFKPLYAR